MVLVFQNFEKCRTWKISTRFDHFGCQRPPPVFRRDNELYQCKLCKDFSHSCQPRNLSATAAVGTSSRSSVCRNAHIGCALHTSSPEDTQTILFIVRCMISLHFRTASCTATGTLRWRWPPTSCCPERKHPRGQPQLMLSSPYSEWSSLPQLSKKEAHQTRYISASSIASQYPSNNSAYPRLLAYTHPVLTFVHPPPNTVTKLQ